MATSRINAQTLRQWIKAGDRLLVVDVRDEDRIGGHIKGSVNYPSASFESQMGSLVSKAESVPKVVFHCQLSQQRGPACAARYARAAPQNQEVYVLTGGFSSWAEEYGRDSSVTDAFIAGFYP